MGIAELREEAEEAILTRIRDSVKGVQTTESILQLAEAYAWACFPNQPHGGHATG